MRFAFLLGCWLCCQSFAAEVLEFKSLAELQQSLAKQISQKKYEPAHVGLKVVSLDSGKVLFEHNANKLLKPASNGKIFTGALALSKLGPDFKIRTSAYGTAALKGATLNGDLILYGRGDHSFSARFFDGKYEPVLDRFVQAIVASGLKRVNGNLVADDTFFKGAPFGSSWSWDDLTYYYGAEVSALTLQDNVVDLKILPGSTSGAPCSISQLPARAPLEYINRTKTVGKDEPRKITIYKPLSENRIFVEGQLPLGDKVWTDAATVSRPALWFAQVMREELAKKGVSISGQIQLRAWPHSPKTDTSKLVEIAHTDSPPMSELVAKMMKPSQNLYAQLQLLQVGEMRPGSDDSESKGLREMTAFLKEHGISRSEALLEEGSGLSRGALVTPNAIVKLLIAMRAGPVSKPFMESLPAAGVDGTLRNRLSDPGLKGNVRAKTGSIRYVNTLSGFMVTKAGEHLVFSIMINNFEGGSISEIDQIVRQLYALKVKSQ